MHRHAIKAFTFSLFFCCVDQVLLDDGVGTAGEVLVLQQTRVWCGVLAAYARASLVW